MIPASRKRSNHYAKVLLLILATASCRDIGAPQVETMEGGGFPVFKSMIPLPGDYIDVQEGGESIIEYDDDTSATSRCPDEARARCLAAYQGSEYDEVGRAPGRSHDMSSAVTTMANTTLDQKQRDDRLCTIRMPVA